MTDNNKKRHVFTKSILARKFIIYIVLFSSVITVVGTSLQLYLDYRKDKTNIQSALELIETTHLKSIVSNLWVNDREQLNVRLDEILSLPDIQYISIDLIDEETISIGTRKSTQILSREYPLVYSFRDKIVNLGSMQIEATLENTFLRLRSRVIVILLTQGIKTFLVSLFIFFVFHLLIGRHVTRMANYSKVFDLDHLDDQLTLNRSPQPTANDELETLVISMNDMRVNLQRDIEKRKKSENINNVLFSISNAVNISNDLDDLYKKIHHYVGKIFDVTNFFIAAVNERKKTLYFPYHVDSVDKDFSPITNFDPEQSLTGVVVSSRKPLLIKEKQLQLLAKRNGVWGPVPLIWMGVPLVVKNEIIGVMAVQSYTDSNLYDERDLEVLVSISDQMAIAIDRKSTRIDLIKSEKKYRDIIDSSPDFHYRTDTEGRIIFISPSAQKMSGYTVEELIGIKMEEFYVNSEERKGFLALLQKKGSITEYETQLKRKDGSIWWASTNAHFFKDNDGNILGVEGVTRDITERKKMAEEKDAYRELLDSVPGYGFAKDLNCTYLSATRPFCDLLKIPYDQIKGKTDYDIFPADLAKEYIDQDKSVMDTGEPIVGEQVTIDANTNQRFTVAIRKHPSFDKNGAVTGIYGMGFDITEIKQAEQEREKLLAQLQQAQKMESIGNLAGGIAHDFNNILSAVLGFTELALDGVEKETPIQKDLQEVYKAGLRAKDLVQQILTYARQSDEKRKPIQVDFIIKEVLKFIRSSIPTTIEIKQNITSTSFIMGSSTQIHRVMMNLCTNAAHAMENEGGTLEVTLKDITVDTASHRRKWHLKLGNYIELKVSDTGDSIDPQIIDKIFEPYFTTKGQGEGTGMGLAMVHGIVESYGGKIFVESTLGKGTIFTIYLPIAKGEKTDLHHKLSELPRGQERILFVDDEPQIVKMASRILGQLGYSVTTRTSSIEALELFRSKPSGYDLVISDVTMPQMTGDHLSKELMLIRPDIPVILCTGYSKKISEGKAAELGIKALAYKPIVKKDLATTVRKVLDGGKQLT